MLAMHMANELLSLPVASVTLALGAVVIAVTSRRARRSLDSERLPLMGVLGAFVFAAQMINFTLPGMPGTSGHLGGGVLLAIVLSPAAAIFTMSSILIVQCLLFQDGGLLALGCNIINMGVAPCLVGWATYRLLLGSPQVAPAWRQYLAAWLACLAGVVGGAALVPLEARASGVLQIPLADFLAIMTGVHLVIGLIEGLITFAVIGYLRRVRPALLGLDRSNALSRLNRTAVAGSLVLTAAVLAGIVSWFASTHPDGLEWSYLVRRYGPVEQSIRQPVPAVAAVNQWQARWSPLTDYDRRQAPLGQPTLAEPAKPDTAWPHVNGWGSLAGVIGTATTLVVLYVASMLMRRRRASPAATMA